MTWMRYTTPRGPYLLVRLDEDDTAVCARCWATLAETPEDEAAGLPIAQLALGPDSYIVAVCPGCRAAGDAVADEVLR